MCSNKISYYVPKVKVYSQYGNLYSSVIIYNKQAECLQICVSDLILILGEKFVSIIDTPQTFYSDNLCITIKNIKKLKKV